MKRHAFICTRTKNLKDITEKLVKYLTSAGWDVKLLIGEPSIFSAYKTAFESTDKANLDCYILCHDDIEILTKPETFNSLLINNLYNPTTGFLGVAGTTYFSEDAVWWNQEVWRRGLHSGLVYHGEDIIKADQTYYGPCRQVAVLDGLFLAASGRTLRAINLEKPSYFQGDWDFYDIYYTTQTCKLGLKNKTLPIHLLHNSAGSLVGRDSWTKNREAYIANNRLPLIV